MDGFSWGDGGGEEETRGHVLLSRFFTGRRESPNIPFFVFILYIEQWELDSLHQVSEHREKFPRPRYPGQTRCSVRTSTTRRPVRHIEDSEGATEPRSVTDSTEQWVWCFMHMLFMLCYFCCMFS